MARLVLWGPVVVYMGGIYYVSSLSQPPTLIGGDKPWHLLAYLALAVLVVRALARRALARIDGGVLISAVAITVAYGLSDEIHQRFVPGRTADAKDLAADTGGAIVGAGACWAAAAARKGTGNA